MDPRSDLFVPGSRPERFAGWRQATEADRARIVVRIIVPSCCRRTLQRAAH